MASKGTLGSRAEKRGRILDKTRELVALHGAEGVTMRTIADASGVSEKTLFNLYRSKRELIALAVHDRSGGVFRDALENTSERGVALFARIAASLAAVTLADPKIARSLAAQLVTQSDAVDLSSLYEHYVSPLLRDMVTDGDLSADAPIATLTRTIKQNVVAAILFWVSGETADGDLVARLRAGFGMALLPYISALHAEEVRRSLRTDLESSLT